MRARSKMERETVILRNGVDQDWQVDTDDPRVIRLLERRGHPGVLLGTEVKRYRLPKSCIVFRKTPAPAASQRFGKPFQAKGAV